MGEGTVCAVVGEDLLGRRRHDDIADVLPVEHTGICGIAVAGSSDFEREMDDTVRVHFFFRYETLHVEESAIALIRAFALVASADITDDEPEYRNEGEDAGKDYAADVYARDMTAIII